MLKICMLHIINTYLPIYLHILYIIHKYYFIKNNNEWYTDAWAASEEMGPVYKVT